MIVQAEGKDIHIIEAILYDAVSWMTNNNLPNLWNEENIGWDSLSTQYDISQFCIYYIEGKPVGCMALTVLDKKYWPNDKLGDAKYLHKLAVKHNYRGLSISTELINYANDIARANSCKYLRLDCNALSVKLCKLYTDNGFKLVRCIDMDNNYKMSLYECLVT